MQVGMLHTCKYALPNTKGVDHSTSCWKSCLSRCRIQRDVSVRGRDVAGVLKQYTTFVKPSYETFVAPSRRHADVIIPWAKDANEVAIELITEHIRSKLKQPDLR